MMMQARSSGNMQAFNDLQDMHASVTMARHADNFMSASNDLAATGADMTQVKTPVTELRRNTLLQASEQSWNNVANQDTWRQAGITAQDVADMHGRVQAQAMEIANGDASSKGYGEATYVSLADQISKLAEKRLQIMRDSSNSYNEMQRQALQRLQTSGNDYTQNRMAVLAMDEAAVPAEAAATAAA